jgi:hypothetical protein
VTGRWIPRPISREEADVVVAALEKAPVGGDRTSLREKVRSLVVIDRCKCGCATIDFESSIAPGSARVVADGLGKTPSGKDVGVLVWGDDQAISGLEIYDMEPESARELPDPVSVKAWG